jgi:hypothetical protein
MVTVPTWAGKAHRDGQAVSRRRPREEVLRLGPPACREHRTPSKLRTSREASIRGHGLRRLRLQSGPPKSDGRAPRSTADPDRTPNRLPWAGAWVIGHGRHQRNDCARRASTVGSRMRSRSVGICISLSGVLLGACGGWTQAHRNNAMAEFRDTTLQKAAFSLDCTVENTQFQLVPEGDPFPNTALVSGCGRKATYFQTKAGWTMESGPRN